eukprot:1595968-Prymnesium_polylepis.1
MFVQSGQPAARPSKKQNAASTDACDVSPRQKKQQQQQCTGDAGAKNTIEVLDSDSLRATFLCLQMPTLRRVKS